MENHLHLSIDFKEMSSKQADKLLRRLQNSWSYKIGLFQGLLTHLAFTHIHHPLFYKFQLFRVVYLH